MGKPNTTARLAAAVMAVASTCALDAYAATERYRVELLVFRHEAGAVTEPAAIERLRGFHDRWTLDDAVSAPGAPVPVENAGTFETLYRRLERLADYTPLTLVSWEQPATEYQPDVRIHDTEIVREDLYFGSESVEIDLEQPRPFEGYAAPLYRLDGTAQLRRSRFLHVDLDLEWRVPSPPDPVAPPEPEAITDAVTTTDAVSESTVTATMPAAAIETVAEALAGAQTDAPAGTELDTGAEIAETDMAATFAPEPFRVHRLRQSRQVETDTMIYFDSDTLGALARVTALGPE